MKKSLSLNIKMIAIIILAIIYCCDSSAKKMIVKGTIYNQDHTPVSNACIYVLESNDTQMSLDKDWKEIKKAYSDQAGLYTIKCNKGDKLFVNFNGELVNEVVVSNDTLNITLHVATATYWDGYSFHVFPFTVMPSLEYDNTGVHYSIDIKYSFAHTNSFKKICNLGFRYLNNNSTDKNQDLYYTYLDIKPPHYNNFFLRKFNPYIDLGIFDAVETGTKNYCNFGYGFGFASPKKYFKHINLQFCIGYSQYFTKSNLWTCHLGLILGRESKKPAGGTIYN